MVSNQKTLLSITEIGGYPDFSDVYRQAGFRTENITSMRKALSALKKVTPDVVVAEFNFQSDFRDRTSSLESLLAKLQGKHSKARVIIFYDKEYSRQFNLLQERFTIFESIPFPIEEKQLSDILDRIVNTAEA
jgi:DNA-binding NtrC family response regulator